MDVDQSAYIDLLKRCLTASIYEESSWVLLQGPLKGERGPIALAQRLIISSFKRAGLRLVRTRNTDSSLREQGLDWPLFGMTMVGARRLENVQSCVETALAENVPGDFVETGVWRGGTCILAKALFREHGATGRSIWCCDSFQGMPVPSDRDKAISDASDFSDREYLAVSEKQVAANFQKFGLLDENVHFVKGWFNESLPTAPIDKISVLRLDGDLYDSTMDALVNLYHKVSARGFVIVDDYYSWAGCRKAIDEFRSEHRITENLTRIDQEAVFWRKATTQAF
jgi:O-methyltransferase